MSALIVGIGKRIKELRTALGLTIEALAESNDLSSSFIWDLENGKKACSLDTLEGIAKSLHTTVHALVGDTVDDDTVLNKTIYKKIQGLSVKEKTKLLKVLENLSTLLK